MSKNEYFRMPSLAALALVPYGMGIVSLGAYDVALGRAITPSPLVPAYNLLSELLPTIALLAWGAHAAEAYYSTVLCRRKNISEETTNKWAVWTFFFGIFQLIYLIRYRPEKK